MKSKRYYFSILFLIILNVGFSQDQNSKSKTEKLFLKDILSFLEKNYDVRFSFNDALVEKRAFTPLTKEVSLKAYLDYLEQESNLSFKMLNARYIVVTEKKANKNFSVCGFLIDEKTNNPIRNASIWIENTSIGVSSNHKGYFELKDVQSDRVIRIDYLGYNSLKKEVFKFSKERCLTIALSDKNEELEEVLISDYLTTGMSKKYDGAIRIAPNKLGILPGLTEPDILQSLQLLPGVQSPSETASNLHVRGGTPDQNLVFFDGIKMYESGHFFGLISSFNPYITKEIAFYKSGTSAKFGDRIGGVLDINSGESIPEYTAGFGFNLLHADVYVKTPLFHNKVGVILSGRRSLTDFWKTKTYQKFSESVFQNTRIVQDDENESSVLTNVQNTFFFHDYNLKVIADITNSDKLVFSNLYNKNELKFYSEIARFRENNTDNLVIRNKGSILKWSRHWNNIWSHKLEFDYADYQSDYKGVREVIRKDPSNSKVDTFEKYNQVSDFGMKIEFKNKLNNVGTWHHGYQLSRNIVNYNYENSGTNGNGRDLLESSITNNTSAFFTEYSLRNFQKWNLNIGLRMNYFSVVREAYFEPRFFVSNQMTDSFQLKFSAEVKNQVLSQLIEFRKIRLGIESEIWALSDGEKIPVLNNYQLTGGFLFQKNGWNFDVDLYHKKIHGLTILTEDVATKAVYLSGLSTTNGIDFLLKKRFGNYRSWISYTLSKTSYLYDRLNNGNPFDGEFDMPHSLVWSHTYSLKRIQFSLGWRIRSGTPYTKGIDVFQTSNGNYSILYEENVNTNRLPPYKKVDVSATYKFKFSKTSKTQGKIGVSFINIFNTKNVLDRSYEIKTEKTPLGGNEKNQLVETDQISIGLTPNLVFRVAF